MPSSVAYFERLTYASIVTTVIVFIITASRSRGTTLGVLPVEILIICLLVWLAARHRKNWARWVYVVCFIGGTPIFVWNGIVVGFQNSISIGLLNSIGLVMQATAVVLLFTAGSQEWFGQGEGLSR